jgi:SAM-dependent methyltransferase
MIHKYYNNRRTDIKSLIPYDSYTFLDIGCATGKFRNNINFECEYWGVEPHKESASIAMDSIDHVLHGKFDEVHSQLPDHYFDCVIIADSLEHMDDTDLFFEVIKSKLAYGGVIIGSIPNVRYISNMYKLIIQKDWKYVESGILDNTHLRFFTKKSLLRTFNNYNFEIHEFYGLNKYTFSLNPLSKIFPKFILIVLSLILGSDTRYLQYAFKISSPNSSA